MRSSSLVVVEVEVAPVAEAALAEPLSKLRCGVQVHTPYLLGVAVLALRWWGLDYLWERTGRTRRRLVSRLEAVVVPQAHSMQATLTGVREVPAVAAVASETTTATEVLLRLPVKETLAVTGSVRPVSVTAEEAEGSQLAEATHRRRESGLPPEGSVLTLPSMVLAA